jgi:hypothetical protein
MIRKILFLDDNRNPHGDGRVYLPPIKEGEEDYVIWVKSHKQFVDWIEKNGLPDHICFDHDLALEHYHDDMYKGAIAYNMHYMVFKEKTGREAAMWLIEHCSRNKLKIPAWTVHSMNPVGRDNIKTLLQLFS